MKVRFSRAAALILSLLLVLGASSAAFAEDTDNLGVDYKGMGSSPVFVYDATYTAGYGNLWNFTGCMPGDTLSRHVSIENTCSNSIAVFLHAEPYSEKVGDKTVSASDVEAAWDFLEKLSFKVTNDADGGTVYEGKGSDVFTTDTSSVSDNGSAPYFITLGQLSSGAKVNLTVALEIPLTLGDVYQDAEGLIKWTIAVYEIQPTPRPTPYETIPLGPPITIDEIPLGPYTGDSTDNTVLIAVCAAAVGAALFLTVFFVNKKRKKS